MVCGMRADELLNVLRRAARSAVNYLRSGRCSAEVIGRGSFGDVTKVFDKEAENRIINVLINELGSAVVVSEELGIKEFGREADWVVIIDPVDGSTNFDAGIPWTAVSIAAARRREGGVTIGDIEAAIVAEVFRDYTYEYSAECGVKVNGGPVRRRESPAKVLLGYFEVPEAYKVVPEYWRVRGRKAALRSLGSAALDIVSVGLGRAEAFVDARAKLRNVDIAASLKIVHELGGRAAVCSDSGLEPAINVRIDAMVKVPCLVVGYDELRYRMICEAMMRVLRSGVKP